MTYIPTISEWFNPDNKIIDESKLVVVKREKLYSNLHKKEIMKPKDLCVVREVSNHLFCPKCRKVDEAYKSNYCYRCKTNYVRVFVEVEK